MAMLKILGQGKWARTTAGYGGAVVLIAGLAFLATPPAWGGVAEGKAAFQHKDYATALKEFRSAAKEGSAEAQYFLGAMYNDGNGVPQDGAEAVKWYRKAAEQGLGMAQEILGDMYWL